MFSKRYPYSGNIYCEHHNSKYKRVNNNGNSYWICNEYAMYGDKTCKSPKLYEKELDKIFKNVYSYLINNFDEIKDKLINIYKSTNFNACNEIERLKKEINNLNYKKESLLELYIEKVIEKDEFETRNNKYNNEIEKLKKEIKELEKKDINTTLKQIRKIELGEFINENFEKLSKLLIDKIVVKKSDDKTRVILNIYINLFNITYIWDYNNFEKISSFCSHNEDNDLYSCFGKC